MDLRFRTEFVKHKTAAVVSSAHNDLFPTDLNKACGNTIDAHEAAQMHQNFSQQLLQDHIAACSLPEHNLISVSNASVSQPINSESIHPAWIVKETIV